MTCLACSITCDQCVSTSTNCTSCRVGTFRTLTGSTCSCVAGYYDDYNISCKLCDYTCATCSGPGNSNV